MGHSAFHIDPPHRHRPVQPVHRQAAPVRRRRGAGPGRRPLAAPGHVGLPRPQVADADARVLERLGDHLPLVPRGYYITGDLVYTDDEGYYYHMDRAADSVDLGGGRFLYTALSEERILAACPDVADCTVIAVRDGGTVVTDVMLLLAADADRRRPGPRGTGTRRARPGRGRHRPARHRRSTTPTCPPAPPARSANSCCARGTSPTARRPGGGVMSRRDNGVVITGIGLFTPVGRTPRRVFDALCDGTLRPGQAARGPSRVRHPGGRRHRAARSTRPRWSRRRRSGPSTGTS